jgi:hypothetical protein
MNAIWILISIFGVISIKMRQIRKIRNIMFVLICFALSRGAFYWFINWIDNSDPGKNQCENIYDSYYFTIVGVLEFFVLVIAILEANKAVKLIKEMKDNYSVLVKDSEKIFH